jgi:hypothetical protein
MHCSEVPLLARPSPSAKDRFLALPARSSDRGFRAAKGRFDPFGAPSGNGRYLRIAIAMVSAANGSANAEQVRGLGLTVGGRMPMNAHLGVGVRLLRGG